MQAVILAGGLGSRLGEETSVRPKPMVEIGGKPLLWHIMKIYSAYGVNDFIVCLGYKGYIIKEFFANYFLHTADVTIDLRYNSTQIHQNWSEPWRITLVETGPETMTGGRLKAVSRYLRPDEPFCFTYGDGVAAIDIGQLIEFHKSQGCKATVTPWPPRAASASWSSMATVRRSPAFRRSRPATETSSTAASSSSILPCST